MLDSKDLLIIEVLRQNSRLPIREIAKRTKLRPSTVHLRIQKMQEDGVIEKFTIKTNNKALDENFIIFLLITTSSDLPPEFFKNEHLKEAFGITGENDLLLKLKFRDIEEFNNYIIELRKNKQIQKTMTLVSTINIKEEL